jgi:hypothetical protein
VPCITEVMQRRERMPDSRLVSAWYEASTIAEQRAHEEVKRVKREARKQTAA